MPNIYHEAISTYVRDRNVNFLLVGIISIAHRASGDRCLHHLWGGGLLKPAGPLSPLRPFNSRLPLTLSRCVLHAQGPEPQLWHLAPPLHPGAAAEAVSAPLVQWELAVY